MGPSRTHIPYTNVYQGRAWFDQIIENSTRGTLVLESTLARFC